MLVRSLALGAVFIASTACAGAMHRASSSDYSANVITEEEISRCDAGDALGIIRKLRAEMLSNRGPTTVLGSASALPVVYLDQVQLGGIEQLAQIPASQVAQIRLYRSWEAVTRFGRDKTAGVIQVITRLPGSRSE